MKYKENLQPVPDRVHGDGGLEAYRLDQPIVYQCYAPEDPLSVAEQTKAQKRKITNDIKKLVDNCDRTIELLGPSYRVSRWVLLTPEYDDKALLSHARTTSTKVRTGPPCPPWCASDFEIVIHTDRDLFAQELAVLHGSSAGGIRMNVARPAEDEVYGFLPDGVAERLREKLRVDPDLAAQPEDLEEYCFEILMDYVYGAQAASIMDSDFSIAYRQMQERAALTHGTLRRRMRASRDVEESISTLANDLARSLREDVPALSATWCEAMARYYIASWWIDCPLRFVQATA